MLKFIFLKTSLYVVITLLSAQALAYDYNDQSNNILIDRVDKVEHEIMTLQKQFYSKGSGNHGVALNGNTAASIDNRIDIIEERMRSIVGQIEQLEHNINILTQKLEKPISNNSSLEQKVDAEKLNNSLGTVSTKAVEDVKRNNSSFDDSMENDFKKAFTLLKTSRKEEAIKYFKQFIKNYPKSDLTQEAYYWLGEIYFTKKDFENASINFLHNYKLSPKGEKAIDSMLKLSISLKNLKRTKDACLILKKLSKDFPSQSIDTKNKANQLNKELNCK